MGGKRILESVKEALAISRKELSHGTYNIHVPESVDVKEISESANQVLRLGRTKK